MTIFKGPGNKLCEAEALQLLSLESAASRPGQRHSGSNLKKHLLLYPDWIEYGSVNISRLDDKISSWKGTCTLYMSIYGCLLHKAED